jgi:hypothetical protein
MTKSGAAFESQSCQGKPGTYLIAALPPRAAVDAVRCTAVKATLLRSQPCAMLPRQGSAGGHSAVQPNIYYETQKL